MADIKTFVTTGRQKAAIRPLLTAFLVLLGIANCCGLAADFFGLCTIDSDCSSTNYTCSRDLGSCVCAEGYVVDTTNTSCELSDNFDLSTSSSTSADLSTVTPDVTGTTQSALTDPGYNGCYDESWFYHSHTHSCIKHFDYQQTWMEAADDCRFYIGGVNNDSMGHLVKIEDQETNAFLSDVMGQALGGWIGLIYDELLDDYRWVDFPNEVPTFFNFAQRPARNASRPYVFVGADLRWVESGEDLLHHFCQHDARIYRTSLSCPSEPVAENVALDEPVTCQFHFTHWERVEWSLLIINHTLASCTSDGVCHSYFQPFVASVMVGEISVATLNFDESVNFGFGVHSDTLTCTVFSTRSTVIDTKSCPINTNMSDEWYLSTTPSTDTSPAAFDIYGCQDDTWTYHSHTHTCLKYFPQRLPWSSAAEHCETFSGGNNQSIPGHLVKIDDQQTNQFLGDFIASTNQAIWIGLYFNDSQSTWHGFPEEDPDFFQFATGTNPSPGDPYVLFHIYQEQSNVWVPVSGSASMSYVCQHDSRAVRAEMTCPDDPFPETSLFGEVLSCRSLATDWEEVRWQVPLSQQQVVAKCVKNGTCHVYVDDFITSITEENGTILTTLEYLGELTLEQDGYWTCAFSTSSALYSTSCYIDVYATDGLCLDVDNACPDNLSCISGRCQCDLSTHYISPPQDLCIPRANHEEACNASIPESCLDETTLCVDYQGLGIPSCLCNISHFWNLEKNSSHCTPLADLQLNFTDVESSLIRGTDFFSFVLPSSVDSRTSDYLVYSVSWSGGTTTFNNIDSRKVVLSSLVPGNRYTYSITMTSESNAFYPVRLVQREVGRIWTMPSKPGEINLKQSQLTVNPMTLVIEPSQGSVQQYVLLLEGTSINLTSLSTGPLPMPLSPGETYNYSIVAFNGNGDASESRNGTFTTLLQKPGPVNESLSQLKVNPMTLVFGPVQGNVSYYLMMIDASNAQTLFLGEANTELLPFDLEFESNYTYRIIATYSNGRESDAFIGSFRTDRDHTNTTEISCPEDSWSPNEAQSGSLTCKFYFSNWDLVEWFFPASVTPVALCTRGGSCRMVNTNNNSGLWAEIDEVNSQSTFSYTSDGILSLLSNELNTSLACAIVSRTNDRLDTKSCDLGFYLINYGEECLPTDQCIAGTNCTAYKDGGVENCLCAMGEFRNEQTSPPTCSPLSYLLNQIEIFRDIDSFVLSWPEWFLDMNIFYRAIFRRDADSTPIVSEGWNTVLAVHNSLEPGTPYQLSLTLTLAPDDFYLVRQISRNSTVYTIPDMPGNVTSQSQLRVNNMTLVFGPSRGTVAFYYVILLTITKFSFQELNVTSTSFTVNLPQGTELSISITAFNENFDHSEMRLQQIIILEPEEYAVTNLTVSNITTDGAMISWNPPPRDQNQVLSFNIFIHDSVEKDCLKYVRLSCPNCRDLESNPSMTEVEFLECEYTDYTTTESYEDFGIQIYDLASNTTYNLSISVQFDTGPGMTVHQTFQTDVKYGVFGSLCYDTCISNLQCSTNDNETSKCGCFPDQFYNNSTETCDQWKSEGESCSYLENECKNNLQCYFEKCGCNETHEYYQQGSQVCTLKKTYGNACESTDECGSNLLCNGGRCLCDDTEYWDLDADFICQIKKTFNDTCNSSNECESNLVCDETCTCDDTKYWDAVNSTCEFKKTFNMTCNTTIECGSNLNCTDDKCVCNNTQYWAWDAVVCEIKKTFENACESTNECGSNLLCNGGRCLCDDTEYWDADSICQIKKTFNDTCNSSNECEGNLVCDETCMCDDTKYWDAVNSTCEIRKSKDEACSDTQDECQDTLQCLSGVCTCNDATEFYNNNTLLCALKNALGSPCVDSSECLQTLTCVNNSCACDWNDQYYNYSSKTCIPRKNRGDLCFIYSPFECKTNLQCLSGSCDCDNVTVFYQPNSLQCEQRKIKGERCVNISYECSSNLQCKENICDCDQTSTYYDPKLMRCENRKDRNESCSYVENECNGNLMCYSQSCGCNETSEYFDDKIQQCSPKLGKDSECSDTVQCMDTLVCLDQKCVCVNSTHFYNAASLSCDILRDWGSVCSNATECSANLQCWSGVCDCDNVTVFYHPNSLQCELRRGINEACATIPHECNDTLTCLNELYVCGCPFDSEYYDPAHFRCFKRKSKGEACSNIQNECQDTLQCLTGLCRCNETTEFYNDNTLQCALKNALGSPCNDSSECTNALSCINASCDCNHSVEYYDSSGKTCRSRRGFNETCSNVPNECIDTLRCQSGSERCLCDSPSTYFDQLQTKCIQKPVYNETCVDVCDSNLQCLGFGTKTCQCAPDQYYVESSHECVKKPKYGEVCDSVCESDLQCVSTDSGKICACPSIDDYFNDTIGQCVAKPVYGEPCKDVCESNLQCIGTNIKICGCPAIDDYFNAVDRSCAPKPTLGEPCDVVCYSNLQCLGTNNKICQCSSNEYYNENSQQCVASPQYLEPCETACISNLQCLGSNTKTCICPSTQYYHVQDQQCLNKPKHGEICDAECESNLLCLGTGIKTCMCAANLFYNEQTSRCLDKPGYGDACESVCDSNFQCLGTSIKQCGCPSTQYFDNGQCIVKPNFGESCSTICASNFQCLGDIAKSCGCVSTHYLNSNQTECVLKPGYGETCISECASNLQCIGESEKTCNCTRLQYYEDDRCLNYELVRRRVKTEFRFSLPWNDELTNPDSTTYKMTKLYIENMIDDTMTDEPLYNGCNVTSFRQGSTIADVDIYEMTIPNDISDSVIVKAFEEELNSGIENDFSLNQAVSNLVNASLISPASQLIIEETSVSMRCIFILAHKQPNTGGVVWYFDGQRMSTENNAAFRSQDNYSLISKDSINIPLGADVQVYRYQSELHIDKFVQGLTGTFECKMRNFGLVSNPSPGQIVISQDQVLLQPTAVLTPLSLYIERDKQIKLTCTITNADKVSFVQVVDMQDSVIVPPSSSNTYSFTPEMSQLVKCIASNSRSQGLRAGSNIVRIVLLEEEKPVECLPVTDDRGTKWPISPAGVIVKAECPAGYTGFASRKCSETGVWEEPNYLNCVQEKLKEAKEQVALLESGVKPSSQTVADIATIMSESVNDTETILTGDIAEVVDIIDDLSQLVAEVSDETEEEEEDLITTEILENFATVSDQILSVDTSEWEKLEEEKVADDPDPAPSPSTGAKLLVALDKLTTTSLKSSNISSKPIVKENIAIKRERLLEFDDISFPKAEDQADEDFNNLVTESQSKVFLSAETMSSSKENVSYSIVLFKGVQEKIRPQTSSLQRKEIKTDIISFSLSVDLDILQPPLNLTFKVPTVNFTDPVCGFLDTSVETLGVWSTRGCQTVKTDSDVVQCYCNHLTNFAVLMSPSGTSSEHHDALSIITIVGCSISILFLLITIFVYIKFWRYVKKDERSLLHLNLSGCLLVAFCVFLGGIEQTENDAACTVIAAILHYLFLTVFFLMLCEGVEIFITVVIIFKVRSLILRLIAAAYVIPLVIVGISLAATQADNYRSDDFCWLSAESNTLWAFAAPALLIILVNMIIMGIALHAVLSDSAVQLQQKRKKSKVKSAVRSICVLTPIFGVTWLFGILAVNESAVAFQYLFVIFNALQGLGIFIVYCIQSKQIKEGFKLSMKRKRAKSFDSTQRPFGVSQKSVSFDSSSNLKTSKMVTAGTPLTGSQFDFGFSKGSRSFSESQQSHNGKRKNSAMGSIEEDGEISHIQENDKQQRKMSQDLRIEAVNASFGHDLSHPSQNGPDQKWSEDFPSLSVSFGPQENSHELRNASYAAPTESEDAVEETVDKQVKRSRFGSSIKQKWRAFSKKRKSSKRSPEEDLERLRRIYGEVTAQKSSLFILKPPPSKGKKKIKEEKEKKFQKPSATSQEAVHPFRSFDMTFPTNAAAVIGGSLFDYQKNSDREFRRDSLVSNLHALPSYVKSGNEILTPEPEPDYD